MIILGKLQNSTTIIMRTINNLLSGQTCFHWKKNLLSETISVLHACKSIATNQTTAEESYTAALPCGVPQGSPLGPFQFTLFLASLGQIRADTVSIITSMQMTPIYTFHWDLHDLLHQGQRFKFKERVLCSSGQPDVLICATGVVFSPFFHL